MQYNYGGAPTDLGAVNLSPSEMCYVQYMPVMMPKQGIKVPRNMKWCLPLIAVAADHKDGFDYMYLTAKHYYTNTKGCNRPGWHSDGFMTGDMNIIWYDCHPTQFCVQGFRLSHDHSQSMIEMEQQARPESVIEYPSGHALAMSQSVIHRVNTSDFEGMRTFVKISLSNSKYNLKGNAHNHMFDYSWDMVERSEHRNHPTREANND